MELRSDSGWLAGPTSDPVNPERIPAGESHGELVWESHRETERRGPH